MQLLVSKYDSRANRRNFHISDILNAISPRPVSMFDDPFIKKRAFERREYARVIRTACIT